MKPDHLYSITLHPHESGCLICPGEKGGSWLVLQRIITLLPDNLKAMLVERAVGFFFFEVILSLREYGDTQE